MSTFRRCTRCAQRTRWEAGDRRCPGCGATSATWWFITDTGTDSGGKRKQAKRGGFKTQKEAERHERELLHDLDRDTYVERSKLTVGRFLVDEWLPAVRPPALRDNTWRDYRVHMTAYVVPALGGVELQKLNPAHLNRLYVDLLANGRTKSPGGLSATTVRHVHVIVHRALRDAHRWGLVARNVADLADPPPSKAVADRSRAAMRTWTADELRVFLEATREWRRWPLWLLAATTGARRGELLALTWRDVDLDGGRITVRSGKTASASRTVDLDPDTVAALREHRRGQLEERLAAGPAWQDSGLVFATRLGGPLHPNEVWKEFVRTCEAVGVPRIRFHDLRHTHATLMLASGANAKVVSERLGHSSVAVTLQIYAHALPGMQRQAAERFGALVFGDGRDSVTHP